MTIQCGDGPVLLFLLAGLDGKMLEFVAQPKLFEGNRRLSPVGGIIGVE